MTAAAVHVALCQNLQYNNAATLQGQYLALN